MSLRKSKNKKKLSTTGIIPIFCLFFLTVLLNAVLAGTESKVDLKGKFSLFSGYESNLFRKPSIMYPDSSNPVEHDGFYGGSADIQASIKMNRRNQISLQIDGDYAPYFNHKQATSGQFTATLDYRCNLTNILTFNIQPAGGYTSRLAIDENSDGDANLYKYQHYGIKSKIYVDPSKAVSLRGYYQFNFNDYEDSVITSSFDNNQNEAAVSIIYKTGKNLNNVISLDLSFLHKQYTTLHSYEYDSSMKTRIAKSPRSYNYFTAELEYMHDFGPVEWKIAYRPRYRIDLYKDFYTYSESRIRSGIEGKLPSKTKYSLIGAWRYRHYTVHTAEQPGPDPSINPDLVIKYFDLSIEGEQKLNKIISLFTAYQITLRRTNTGVLSFKTYRNYTDNIVMGGISVKW